MLKLKMPKTLKAKRALDKRAPKLVENAKKTLIHHGTKTSYVLNAMLAQIFHLKKGLAVKFSRKNENVRPFESSGETSLEFFSLKTDCSFFVVGGLALSNNIKGLKRERREGKTKDKRDDHDLSKKKMRTEESQ